MLTKHFLIFIALFGLFVMIAPSPSAGADITCREGFVLNPETESGCIPLADFHVGDYNPSEYCSTMESWLVVKGNEFRCELLPNTKEYREGEVCGVGYYIGSAGAGTTKYCFLYICHNNAEGYNYHCPQATSRTDLLKLDNDGNMWTASSSPSGNRNTSIGVSCGPSGCTIFDRFNQILNLMAMLVVPIVALVIIIGGIQYTTSAGSPDATKAAKSRIVNGITALIAFMLVWSILKWLIPGGSLG